MRNHSSCSSSGKSIDITERSDGSLKLEAFQERCNAYNHWFSVKMGVEKHSSEY
jgi:hypothetical protein